MRILEFKPGTLPIQLEDLIRTYNLLDEANDPERLFYLEKIVHTLYKELTPEVIAWRNQLNIGGLRAHLKYYNIQLNASPLLQSIQFSTAVDSYAKKTKAQGPAPAFSATLTTRSQLFSNTFDQHREKSRAEFYEALINDYTQTSRIILIHYQTDKDLQEKIEHHKQLLSLSATRLNEIQQLVQTQFNEDQLDEIREIPCSLDDTPIPLVIRVGQSEHLGREHALHAHAVGEYFPEHYATMVISIDREGSTVSKLVVVSEPSSTQFLLDSVESLSRQHHDKIISQMNVVFTNLNDFCLQLIASKHYHFDIRLTNFFLDGANITLKGYSRITRDETSNVLDLNTPYSYAPPEYRSCLEKDNEGEVHIEQDKKEAQVAMIPYMSFQIGMALKEFLFRSELITHPSLDKLLIAWIPISQYAKQPVSNSIKNISVLVQELTRFNPADRLSLAHFQELLPQVHVPPEEFLTKLEQQSPQIELNAAKEMNFIRKILSSNTNISSLNHPKYLELFWDPRTSELRKILKEKISGYLNLVNEALLNANIQKSGIWYTIRRVTGLKTAAAGTINDIEMPSIDKPTQEYLIIATKAGIIINSVQKELYQKYITREKPTTEQTASSTNAILVRAGTESELQTSVSQENEARVPSLTLDEYHQEQKSNDFNSDLARDVAHRKRERTDISPKGSSPQSSPDPKKNSRWG